MPDRILDFSRCPTRLRSSLHQLVIEQENTARTSVPFEDVAVVLVSHPQVTTISPTPIVSQTARFLKMSEERQNELLNDHVIDYRLDNGQRMVNLESIMMFDRETRAMEEGCAALTRMSQAMGTYDD